ncbi:MAG TPA: flippase [Pseudobacteroides sp.]|nr:flippase [Pseudobacteroides sp.]
MSKSIAKNLGYNLLLNAVSLILPLITMPYISRVLGVDGVGIYNYTLSITQYFIIFGSLGLTMYGNRQIAYTRDDKEKMSRTFWSILILRITSTGFATVLYYLIFGNIDTYREIYMIQAINIISAMVDISWLYIGLEDFKKTVTRNLAVKIIGVCLIFLFVKTQNDLKLYVLINVLMVLLGNLIMWVYLPGILIKTKIRIREIKDHLLPAVQLFIPQIAIQVYVVIDKSMIGLLSNVEEVGLYAQAENIVKAALAMVTALGTVMLPRMSNIFANGDKEKMDSYLNASLRGVAYAAVPMFIGIACISKEFVGWFFGAGFELVTYLIMVISPILYFIAMSNVMGVQYLLPSNRIKAFTVSVTTGAAVNVILNFLMIPPMKSLGASIATVAAEFSVAGVQFYYLRKEIKVEFYLESFIKYIFASAVMAGAIRIIGNIMGVGIDTTVLQGIIGTIVYIIVLILLKEKVNLMLCTAVSNRIGIRLRR